MIPGSKGWEREYGEDFYLPLLAETDVFQRAELLTIPEWGGRQVEVRPMSAGDRINYLALVMLRTTVHAEAVTDWAALLPAAVIPSTWSPLFEDGLWRPGRSMKRVFRWDDWDLLGKAPSTPLVRIHNVAMRLSALEGDDELRRSFLRLTHDGELRLLMELAFEWGIPLTELAARMPAWELTWWRSFLTLRNDEQQKAMGGSSGKQDLSAGFG